MRMQGKIDREFFIQMFKNEASNFAYRVIIELLCIFFVLHRQQLLKWNGWGYNDSRFAVKDGIICFTGKR
jgi:hypothetical protein